jgi:hypothetical protein
MCAFLAIMLASMAALFVQLNRGATRERGQTRAELSALYAAEAGARDALADLRGEDPIDAGTEDAPASLGALSYWVSTNDLGQRTTSILGTGSDGRTTQRVELVVRQVPDGFFQYGAFGADYLNLDSNAFIDSYDSNDGDYATQFDATLGYALEGGTSGSNGDITLDANASIFGDAAPGYDNVVNDASPQSYVSGSTAPAEEDLVLDPIVVPSLPAYVLPAIIGAPTIVPPGDHDLGDVTVRDVLTLVGPARIVLSSLIVRSGAAVVIDASLGPVEIYGTGTFDLRSNSSFTSIAEHASDVTVFLSGNNISGSPAPVIAFNSNSAFTGAIYAPDASITVESNFSVFGSVIAEQLTLASNSEIHFDEDLLFLDDGTPPVFETVAWRPISPSQAALLAYDE